MDMYNLIFILLISVCLFEGSVGKGELSYLESCDQKYESHRHTSPAKNLCNESQNLVCGKEGHCQCEEGSLEFINVSEHQMELKTLSASTVNDLVDTGFYPDAVLNALKDFSPGKCVARLHSACKNDRHCGPHSKCKMLKFAEKSMRHPVCACDYSYRPYKRFLCVENGASGISGRNSDGQVSKSAVLIISNFLVISIQIYSLLSASL